MLAEVAVFLKLVSVCARGGVCVYIYIYICVCVCVRVSAVCRRRHCPFIRSEVVATWTLPDFQQRLEAGFIAPAFETSCHSWIRASCHVSEWEQVMREVYDEANFQTI